MSWDRVERLLGGGNLERLSHKRVAIVGLGSGGGYVALTLAMSGVGKFVLVDDDALEESNIVRHVADRRYLGMNKAQAVAELIRQRNPQAEVTVVEGRIEDHHEALDHVDLLVPAVDGEGAKYVMNELALQRNLTAIYAGVFERGEGGDAVIIRPYDGPCYACWAAELREGLGLSASDGGEELDYGMIGADGTLEAEPGLWLHVTRIAATQADLALNELLYGTDVYQQMPGNTVIMANRAIEIIEGQLTPPYGAVWVTMPRDPRCLVCGDAARQRGALRDEQEDADVSLDELIDSSGLIFEDDSGE